MKNQTVNILVFAANTVTSTQFYLCSEKVAVDICKQMGLAVLQ